MHHPFVANPIDATPIDSLDEVVGDVVDDIRDRYALTEGDEDHPIGIAKLLAKQVRKQFPEGVYVRTKRKARDASLVIDYPPNHQDRLRDEVKAFVQKIMPSDKPGVKYKLHDHRHVGITLEIWTVA